MRKGMKKWPEGSIFQSVSHLFRFRINLEWQAALYIKLRMEEGVGVEVEVGGRSSLWHPWDGVLHEQLVNGFKTKELEIGLQSI